MLASTFRMLAVVIFAVHIFFVISGEAAIGCNEVLSWKIETADEWADHVSGPQFDVCLNNGSCVNADRDFKVKKGDARMERVSHFTPKCRKCVFEELLASVRKVPHINECMAAKEAGKFAQPKLLGPPQEAKRPSAYKTALNNDSYSNSTLKPASK